jgi:hypothetical protein
MRNIYISVLLFLAATVGLAALSDSSSLFANTTKNLTSIGQGKRDVAGATTDVWAHDGYAYTGTFNNPCGGDPDAGVWIWDVQNKKKVSFVGIIQSPTGSRSNDVKVAAMNSGDILVHSNESCAGGPGGYEIYNVDDPAAPVHLAHVQTDDVNTLLRDNLGFTDFGVHNLFLFTQGELDYVAASVESEFGNFQIFDITDPSAPSLVGFWGTEQLHRPDVADWVNLNDFDIILDADAYLSSGFGASQNRFLHDMTITADGTQAYLANWDAVWSCSIGAPTNLPGVFVGHSTGLAIAGVATAGELVIGGTGASVSASTVSNGWGGFRIWDYSDSANPVLATTFNTDCSAYPNDPGCDPTGTYTAHNVIVETTDKGLRHRPGPAVHIFDGGLRKESGCFCLSA